MKKILFFVLFVCLVLVFASCVLAIDIITDIDKVPDSKEIVKFRGCVEGNTGIILELRELADSRAFAAGIDNPYVVVMGKRIDNIFNGTTTYYGPTSILKYEFVAEGHKIKAVYKEMRVLIDKWSLDVKEVKIE